MVVLFGPCSVVRCCVVPRVVIISQGKTDIPGCFTLIAYWCHVTVSILCLFLMVPWVGLQCVIMARTGPEFIQLFPCSIQLSTKFILLINVKIPTIVSILTFISMINTKSERPTANIFFICRYFKFLSSWNFVLCWVEHEKSFITSGPSHIHLHVQYFLNTTTLPLNLK